MIQDRKRIFICSMQMMICLSSSRSKFSVLAVPPMTEIYKNKDLKYIKTEIFGT